MSLSFDRRTTGGGEVDFPRTLEALLVAEYGKTPDEAAALVKKHARIVMAGVMSGLTYTSVRATAIAIEAWESEKGGSDADV